MRDAAAYVYWAFSRFFYFLIFPYFPFFFALLCLWIRPVFPSVCCLNSLSLFSPYRAYEPHILAPHVKEMAVELVVASLFDRYKLSLNSSQVLNT